MKTRFHFLKTSFLLIFVTMLAVSLFTGCKTPGGGPLKSINTRPDSAIVIGRIHVEYEGQDLTRKTRITWQRQSTTRWNPNPTPYTYTVESDDGCIITSLPLGAYSFAELQHPKRSGLFAATRCQITGRNFYLTKPGSIYYLGDLRVNWIKNPRRGGQIAGNAAKATAATTANLLLGLVTGGHGAIFDPSMKIEEFSEVSITDDHFAELKAEFDSRFPNNNLPVEKVWNPDRYCR